MKVLHLLSQVEPTGVEYYVLTLSNWLRKQGCEVQIVSNCLHVSTDIPFMSMEIHTKSRWIRLKSIAKLRQKLKKDKIQILHCHSRAAARIGYWASLGLPTTMVSTVHGIQHASFSKKAWDIYGRTIFGICSNVLESLEHELKMNPRKMVLLGNPVASLKNETFIETSSERFRIAIISRPSGPKGERARELLEKSFGVLLEHFPNLEIDVIGIDSASLGEKSDKHLKRLETLFPGRLRLLGFVPGIHKQFASYRLILGSGRVAIEALFQGVPVFAIGEFSSEGLIRLNTYTSAKKSNFGDIGPSAFGKKFDYPKITRELISYLMTEGLSAEERRQLQAQAEQDFSVGNVGDEIIRTYRAYWKKCD